MLQTRYKSRLPRGFSYPVGLQDLDKVLGDISQATDLKVTFSNAPLSVRFSSLVKRDLRHQVLNAQFWKQEKRPSIGNDANKYLRGQWSITVYPVASVRRSQARELLIDALPSVREWFSRTRPESWYHGRKVCEVWFDPLEGTMALNDIVEAI